MRRLLEGLRCGGSRRRRNDRWERTYLPQCGTLEFRQLLSAGAVPAPPVMPALAVGPVLTAPTPAPTGLTPLLIRSAYGLAPGAGTGAGQTIAIVDAYFDPTVAADLAQFDAAFGLPTASLTQIAQAGLTTQNAAWSLETALDVEWAHAIAPAANLVLVETGPSLGALMTGVRQAAAIPGVAVVSISWGANEFAGETAFDSILTTPAGHVGGAGMPGGVTFVAATGDHGQVQYPAASPNVLAVGGSSLSLTASGTYGGETIWPASGHGASAYEPVPAWQAPALEAAGLPATGRTVPDVVWSANPSPGVAVYSSAGGSPGWYQLGGTSAAAPAWAGLVAIADQTLAAQGQGSLANAQALLYSLPSSAFHSVAGSAGQDAMAGLGSPRAQQLIPAIASLSLKLGQSHPAPASLGPAGLTPQLTLVLVSPAASGPSTSLPSNDSSSLFAAALAPPPPPPPGITPLNPVQTPSLTISGPSVIYVIPPPLVIVHLSSSSVPAINLIHLGLALSEEQPTILTHFGQGPEHRHRLPIRRAPLREIQLDSIIDVIEPFRAQPLAPSPPRAVPELTPGNTPQTELVPMAPGLMDTLDPAPASVPAQGPAPETRPTRSESDSPAPAPAALWLGLAAWQVNAGQHLPHHRRRLFRKRNGFLSRRHSLSRGPTTTP